jgi:hypothetical protein
MRGISAEGLFPGLSSGNRVGSRERLFWLRNQLLIGDYFGRHDTSTCLRLSAQHRDSALKYRLLIVRGIPWFP